MKINVKGMNCKHCEKRVDEALKSLGLKKIKIDLKTGEVSFKNQDEVSFEVIKEKILETGYEVE